MISKKRLEKIYEIYEIKYELFRLTEELTSKKSFEYMEGFFRRIEVSETLTNDQLAFNFLDSENRSDVRLNKAINRLTTAPEWTKEEIMSRIDDYMRNFDTYPRDPKLPSRDVMMEAYEDLKTLQNMREKAIADPEYRQALIELFLVGSAHDQVLLKSILSPTGMEDE